MRPLVTIGALSGLVSLGGLVQGQTIDTAAYHGGHVLSPTITCLMWSPPAANGGFTSTDQTHIQDYLNGMRQYFANQAMPPGSTGAGLEPVPRQYGVWGAYFSGSCTIDHTAPAGGAPIDLGDHSANSVIAQEITTALGPSAYSQNTIVMIFTNVGSQPPGWAYGASFYDPQHWSIGSGQYIAAVPFDLLGGHYDWASHELIETATDPEGSSWLTDPHAAGCGNQTELCDDGDGFGGITLQYPPADGYGTPGNPTDIVTTVDNIDGPNNGLSTTSYPCPSAPYESCTYIGNKNQCGSTLLSGYPFTATTTTPPVVVLQTGSKTNVIARTPTGLVHLVSSDDGFSYTTVSPSPVGQVSDLPSVYSKDGATIDMYGRGLDGALYHWFFDGYGWSGPTWLGGQMNGPPSAICGSGSPGTQPNFAFVLGTDGNLYVWTDNGWNSVQMPPNIWAMSPPQVVMRRSDNTCADIYFTGSDGNLYFEPCWDGVWQTVPGVAGVNGFGQITSVSLPASPEQVELYMKAPVDFGGGATLRTTYQAGAVGNNVWYLNSVQPGVGPVGAVKLSDGGQTWLFSTYGNQVYGAVLDSNAALVGQSQLSGMPTVTSPVSAFTPDNWHVLAFARRQSDGHLVQMLWVGGFDAPGQFLSGSFSDLNVPIM